MRIIGGQNKGCRLKTARKGIRPTRAVARSAIFNILSGKLNDAVVLDCFAGSGAIGLESIARGASKAFFIEKNPAILHENIERLSFQDRCCVVTGDFRLGLKKISKRRFDIIFIDPPYHKNLIPKTLEMILHLGLLNKEGVIVAEYSFGEKFILPDRFHITGQYRYGATVISLIRF